MKKNISLQTLLFLLCRGGDYDSVLYAKERLGERYGEEAAALLANALGCGEKAELNAIMADLTGTCGLDLGDAGSLFVEVSKVRGAKGFPISNIMELYHSGNDFLVKKSKELVVENYERYVYSVIHKLYSSYIDRHGDDLYQCGVIGLLKAMEGYNEEKGAFTTYSKPFIMHEITVQLNFFHNDTTVHYNNIQKKITAAIDRLKEEGMEPTIQRISIITELRPEIIEREMDCMASSHLFYLDADEDNKDSHDRVCEYEKTPEALCLERERTECLMRAIEQLPDTVRKVVLLRHESAHTNEEIAKLLHITIGQVKTNYQKGIRLMHQDPGLQRMFPEYITDAEREMLKYAVPVSPSRCDIDEQIDGLLEAMGTLPPIL